MEDKQPPLQLQWPRKYVFKMSNEKAEICVQMDVQNSEHPLSKEYCFLDAVHSRCQGFKTLTLWVWHPTLNELINLATMECEAETSESIQIFWTNVNEVSILSLKKYWFDKRNSNNVNFAPARVINY